MVILDRFPLPVLPTLSFNARDKISGLFTAEIGAPALYSRTVKRLRCPRRRSLLLENCYSQRHTPGVRPREVSGQIDRRPLIDATTGPQLNVEAPRGQHGTEISQSGVRVEKHRAC